MVKIAFEKTTFWRSRPRGGINPAWPNVFLYCHLEAFSRSDRGSCKCSAVAECLSDTFRYFTLGKKMFYSITITSFSSGLKKKKKKISADRKVIFTAVTFQARHYLTTFHSLKGLF